MTEIQIEDALYFIAQRGWKEQGKTFFEALLTYLTHALDMRYAIIGCFIPDHDAIETLAFYQDGELMPSMTYALEGTPCQDVIGKDLCHYTHELYRIFPADALFQEIEAQSYIGIPLSDTNGNPIGILNLFDTKPMQNLPLAQNLLRLVAVRASHEVERLRDETLMRDRLRFEQLLSSISNQLLMWSISDSIYAILKQVQQYFDVDRCIVLQLEDDSGIYITHQSKRDDLFSTENVNLAAIKGYSEKIMNGETIVVEDYQAQKAGLDMQNSGSNPIVNELLEKLRSHLMVPICSGNRVLGAIGLTDYQKPRYWSEVEIQRMRAIGELFGNVLLRQEAENKLRQRNRELEAMLEISNAAGSTLLLDEVLETLLTHLEILAPYRSASIALLEGDTLRFIAGRGFPTGFDVTRVEIIINDKTSGQVFNPLDKPHILADVREHPDWVVVPGIEYIRSCISAPLIYQGTLIGVMYFDHDKVNFYNEDHLQIATAVAQQAAIAIENARLYGELEQRVAQRTRELSTEKKQTETILSHVTEGIVFTDINGDILYLNPGWEKLTGYHYDEAVSQNIRLLQNGQTPPHILENIWETILTGKTWNGIISNRRKDGTFYDAAVTIVPVLDENGQISHIVDVHRDVTEERRIVAMKERFIADAAHDLGNPVAVLQTSLDMLKKFPEQLEKRLPIIEEQTTRLTDLIRDLLTVSRLDRKALQPVKEKVNLNTLAHQVIQSQMTLALEKRQTLRLNELPGIPVISADRGQVERVIVNLISNAINYTPTGGRIMVSVTRQQGMISLSVQDTGIGIRAEEMPFIFNRFFRSREAQEMANGTGLGLPIVKEMVELNGGQIDVQSAGVAGKGTLFRVSFPAVRS